MLKTYDLRNLSDDELLRLNHEVIARLKVRQRLAERTELQAFGRGDNVVFDAPEGGRRLRGTIVRVNHKSLTSATDGGTWRFAPCLVSGEKMASKTRDANALQLKPQERH